MKLLLVLGSDETHKLITHYVKPLGFELIRYSYVQKAMDNIDEIDPQGIIISAKDFPRHWKIMVQFVRYERPREACPIIILKGDNFSLEEASKASFIGVSGIIPEILDKPSEVDRLQGILSRFLPVEEKRRVHRFHAEQWQHFGFVFIHPVNNSLITGEVKTISAGGLSFLPYNASLINYIPLYSEIGECSLRAGDSILSPICRLARTGRIISMEFIFFPEGELDTLTSYIESLPLRQLRDIEKTNPVIAVL